MRAQWQIPRGVSGGVWQYLNREAIAGDYDDYFSDHPLFGIDQAFVSEYVSENVKPDGLIADLGCGTGRALVPLVRAGYRGLAIDLSSHMLEVVQEKAIEESLNIQCLQANLVELDGVAGESVDAAICLFSTLGMIQGHRYRKRALGHFARMLKPGGGLVLHVHNLWFNLRDPRGPWWIAGSWWKSRFDATHDWGDKTFDYRGVRDMFLHVFRASELRKLIRAAGLRVKHWAPLATAPMRPLPASWFLGNCRAIGWIVVATKPES